MTHQNMAGPVIDHLHRLHKKMQAVEGLRSMPPAYFIAKLYRQRESLGKTMGPSARLTPPTISAI